MKIILTALILLRTGTPSFAQFAGYYTTESLDDSNEIVRFILEETGHFHIFAGAQYHKREWKKIDPNKIELVLGEIDLVDFFVSSGNGRSGQVCYFPLRRFWKNKSDDWCVIRLMISGKTCT